MYRQRRHVSVEDTISLGGDTNGDRSPAGARRQEFASQVRDFIQSIKIWIAGLS